MTEQVASLRVRRPKKSSLLTTRGSELFFGRLLILQMMLQRHGVVKYPPHDRDVASYSTDEEVPWIANGFAGGVGAAQCPEFSSDHPRSDASRSERL
jgi:hypothetical protein